MPAALFVIASETYSPVVSACFATLLPTPVQPFASQPSQQAMSSSSHQDPRCDAQYHASAGSSSDSAALADIGQQEEQGGTHVMVEKGAHFMLQQHLHHFGALTVSEQQRWKQPIVNALRSKSFNDGSKYFLEKLRTPFKEEFMNFLLFST